MRVFCKNGVNKVALTMAEFEYSLPPLNYWDMETQYNSTDYIDHMGSVCFLIFFLCLFLLWPFLNFFW